jgi:hypothetical protein
VIKWLVLFLPFSFLTACTGSNTDPLEPHQIVTASGNRWVHWDENAPVDVTQEKTIRPKRVCPQGVSD